MDPLSLQTTDLDGPKIFVAVHSDIDSHALSPRHASPRSSVNSTRPFDPVEPDVSKEPRTIILALWPHALAEQIKYYVTGYETLFPTARVLTMELSTNIHIELFDTMKVNDEKANESHSTLIHVFGDAAAQQTCHLLRFHRTQFGQPLNVGAIVFDIIPALRFPTSRTLARSPVQLLVFLYIGILSCLYPILDLLPFGTPKLSSEQVRETIQDHSFLPHEARKCYVLPDSDVMFAWERPKFVEWDAGLKRHDAYLKRALVDNEPRWSGNQERYWQGIEKAWEG